EELEDTSDEASAESSHRSRSHRSGSRNDRGDSDSSRAGRSRSDRSRSGEREDRSYGTKENRKHSDKRLPRDDRNQARGESRGGAQQHRNDQEEQIDISPRRVKEDLSGEDVRLYIGQGTRHGMSEELFRQLATEFGEID